jgi:hypothetical protein
MADTPKDFNATVVGMCKDLCDIAHVLSRATCIPGPEDQYQRDLINSGLRMTTKGILETTAAVLTLATIAPFDTTEIEPEGVTADMWKTAIDLLKSGRKN